MRIYLTYVDGLDRHTKGRYMVDTLLRIPHNYLAIVRAAHQYTLRAVQFLPAVPKTVGPTSGYWQD